MSLFRSAAKWMFLPFIRASQDVGRSIKNTKVNLELVKQRRQENIETAKAASEYLDGMSRREKFDHIVELNSWTQPELEKQLIAVRRARLALISFAAFGVVLILGSGYVARFDSFVPNMILAGASFLVSAMLVAACSAMALRYAWWEYSLVHKEILPFRDYLAMGQFIKRLLY